MDGLYFALGNLAVCFIVFWAMINDRPQLAGRTVGLLAMRDDDSAPLAAPKPPRH